METTLAHAGCRADDGSGALVAPIHVATTFERGPGIDYPRGYIYSRISNPGRSLFEVTMAKVEGGVSAAAFGSGMAAIQAVLMAFPQGVVVLPDDLYHGVVTLIEQVLAPWGMQVVRYSADGGTGAISDALDEAIALAGASKPPAASFSSETGTTAGVPAASNVLLWMETPSNPLLRIVDIRAACAEAKKRGVATAVDATWLTPILCRPIELGADVVVHSVTKYLAGHSDVLAGVVVAAGASDADTSHWQTMADSALDPRCISHTPPHAAASDAAATTSTAQDLPSVEKAGDAAAIGWWGRVRSVQRAGGGVAGPFECFLALRGLRTLSVRVRQQCHNAMALAVALEAHSGVDAVFYPGLKSHPQHELAKTALFASTATDQGAASSDSSTLLFGAMLSVRVAGGEEAALRVASALRVFHTATSLGGTESLVEHRATIEPEGSKTPRDLLRVSIGLEPAAVLIQDWMTALDK